MAKKAKKIKFPLKLKDDFPARNLEELKQHFDLDKIVTYFLDGKLLTWLEARYYDIEAKAVRELKKNDEQLPQKLSQIFGIANSEFDEHIDLESVEERNRKLAILRQYTSDPTVLEQVANVAFNQEDLGDLLDDGVQKIYLCNNSFIIPLSVENKTYIGLGKAVAVIRSATEVDFSALNVKFIDVTFDDSYSKLVSKTTTPIDTVKIFMERANVAKSQENYAEAMKYYLKAADFGNGEAMDRIAEMYNKGLGVPQDNTIAFQWYKKSAETGFPEGINDVGLMYYYFGINGEPDYSEAVKWFKKASEANVYSAYNMVGWMYQNGQGVPTNYTEAISWYTKAAEHNVGVAFNNLGWMYDHSMGVPYDHNTAMNYYRRGAELDNLESLLNLGLNLFQSGNYDEATIWFNRAIKQNSGAAYNLLGVIRELYYNDWQTAKQYYESAGRLDDIYGMFNAGRIHEKEENYNGAFMWYSRAAEKGHVDSIYAVGRFYNNGYSVTRNISMAESFYKRAANMGSEPARAAYQRLQREHSYANYGSEILWNGFPEPQALIYE